MQINRDELWTGWMTWEQIEPYKEQIIDMEYDSMVTWHYPDWDLPRRFTEEKITGLQQHLANGNTWFGARFIVGSCWVTAGPMWAPLSTAAVGQATALYLFRKLEAWV